MLTATNILRALDFGGAWWRSCWNLVRTTSHGPQYEAVSEIGKISILATSDPFVPSIGVIRRHAVTSAPSVRYDCRT